MTVEEIVEELSTLGKRKTPKMIIESVLFYYAAIILNKYNIRKSSGSKVIKYFSIVFASSGIGKSYTLKQIEKLFDLDNYPKAMMTYYNNQISSLPEEPDDIREIRRYMPKSTTVGIEGTSEGLYQVIQSQKASGFGSVNLSSEEFTEHITSSAGLLSKLKEISDGRLKAKIIKGDDNTEMKEDLEGIIANFIGLGSKKAANLEAKKELKRIASSGLYRRTFIIDSNELVEKNTVDTNIEKTKEYIGSLNENFKQEFINRRKLDIYSEKFLDISNKYKKRADEIDTELIENAQKNQLDEFAQYDTGSLEIIESLAHIIAFLEWDSVVTEHHLDKAYTFFKVSRKSVEDTFKSMHPYKIMYDLLKLKDNMTISEMAEFDETIPIAKSKVKDNIDLLEELCYRKDEVLIHNEGKVTRFRIETLPVNKLDKLIFSIDTERKGRYAINYKPIELSWEQVEKLVLSEKAESFTTAHFRPSGKSAIDGHRRAESYIEGANMIAFDIDDGMTIEEAETLLSEFTYLIYTSKSHKIEKYNYRDRFRILLPTKSTFYVTPDQHKQMYENIEDFLGIKNNDVQTRNSSRLWYTNPKAIIFKNSAELIDVTPLLPSTEKSDDFLPKMSAVNDEQNSGNISNREAGYYKWFLSNTSEGNRNGNLFNAAKFFKDIGSDYILHATRLNNMLSEPISEKELNAILRSVK